MRLHAAALFTALCAALLVTGAGAVTTSDWTHTTKADFSGKTDSVVVSDYGELRLSRGATPVLEPGADLDIVYASVCLPDGSLIIATGATGSVSKIEGKTRRDLYSAGPNAIVTSLALTGKGQILAGISGAGARLVGIDPASGKATDIYKSDTIQFIWAILPMEDGSVLLGTGPTGQLLRVKSDGTAKVVLQTQQKNILSILPQAPDQVVIGTDPDGLVMRVNIASGDWFVLYDAKEPEIVSLALAADGSIYVAASSPVEAPAPATQGAAPARRELGPDVPIRREPPSAPEPPVLPNPDPGEPEPIPQKPVPGVALQGITVQVVNDAKPDAPSTQPAASEGAAPTAGESDSSAVYRIAPAGFVTEIFRAPVTIHCMLQFKNALLLGTGLEGSVYELRPETEEKSVVLRTESRDVSSLTLTPAGNIAVGLANAGGLLEMTTGVAKHGTYTSEVLDAGQIAQFGKLQLQGTMPAETSVTVSTRSGNLENPDSGGWSAWSAETPATEFMSISSPAARFAQYRLSFGSKDPSATPTVEEVKLNYLLPNMPPRISSMTVEPEAAEPHQSPSVRAVSWDVADPNGDTMIYQLHYRMGHRGAWILLADKLKEPTYRWNTRQIADGRYQVRVTASDHPSNAASKGLTAVRYSDSVHVDNTPPAIGDIVTAVNGNAVDVKLRAVDRASTVMAVSYSIDSSDDWQAAASSDMLYDSPDETVRFVARDLAAGTHQIAVRAEDSQGNTAYETLIVTVDK